MGLPHNADTFWVLSDPLGDDFGRTVASSVLHAVGDRGLSRGGSFVRRLPVRAVGELRSRVLVKLGASNSGRQAVLDRCRFGSGDDDPDKQREKTEPVVGRDAGIDLRTCWIR